MSQDGRIDRVCAEHKKPAVIAAAITRAAHCEVTPRATIPLLCRGQYVAITHDATNLEG